MIDRTIDELHNENLVKLKTMCTNQYKKLIIGEIAMVMPHRKLR